MAVNYHEVIDELTGAGLILRDGLRVGDGKTARCYIDGGDREKRGWYRLTEVLIDGEYYLVGAYGIWHGNDNGKVSIRPDRKVRMSPEQRAAIRARITADAKKAKAQREAEAERAARVAARVWRRYEPSGHCEYLDRKQIGAHGVRFHPAGSIAVPMLDVRGKLWGLQIIRGASRPTGKLEKQYWPKGMMSAGRFHVIGGTPRGVTLLCEGYATGATLHEATGLPVVVAFAANNLLPVAKEITGYYRTLRLLVCADDDYLTPGNPGVTAAQNAAVAVGGQWVAPAFAGERSQERKGPTDYNDLALVEGPTRVRTQIEAALAAHGWLEGGVIARGALSRGEGGAGSNMPARLSVEEAVERYWGTYGFGGKVLFDQVDGRLVHKDDVLNLLPRHGWEHVREHPDWRVARDTEIGFDPSESDPAIRCNLFRGWPTEPKAGECRRLLELLEYLCNGDENAGELYRWVLRWLALPLQRRGTKMQSAIVVHGPQGTGKSLFFETYGQIYGEYARVLGQEAIEDKFNADWAEKKLFILADEVLARADMYHVKNRLKGFITGDTIRVNPKNVAAHTERNQMNIVFLSNERQPTVLENDDRRHCVIWTPPALPRTFFEEVVAEIDAGGVAALHHYLLHLDLGDFTRATPPPMSASKRDLIEQSTSSEERFIREWIALELDHQGTTLPFCPCLGTDLYRAYQRWCDARGERRRRMQDLVGHCNKLVGWRAGQSERTWANFHDRRFTNRKMVIPSEGEVAAATARCETGAQQEMLRERFESKTAWLTHGYFAFRAAVEVEP